jgi:hypothetical protein
MHPQRVLDSRPISADTRLACTYAYWHDINVNIRGPPPIESKLVLTIEKTATQLAKIQEIEFDWFLYLVRERSGEDYPGDMGFNDFN